MIIFSLFPHLLLGQGLFDFEIDSSLSSKSCPGSGWVQVPEGRWNCSSERAIAGNFSLKHDYDNLESACDYLIYSHPQIDPEDSLLLSFRIRHGYTPSSANNWQLALASELSKDEQQIQTGIVLGVNYLGSDDLVKIWNVVDGKPLELCVTALNYQEEIGIRDAPLFALEWHPEGELKLYLSKDSAQKVVQLASCKLGHLPAGQELLVRYAYTSARDRCLWLDDVLLQGSFIKDTQEPRVRKVEVLGAYRLKVIFSEPVKSMACLEQGTFLLNGREADSCMAKGAEIFLKFAEAIPNRIPQSLVIREVCDRMHNCLVDTAVIFQRNEAEWGDVVFSEVMADPDPPILLPEEEYLELYNRSEYPMDLSHWLLHVNHRVYDRLEFYERSAKGLSEADSWIEPNSYKVIKGVNLPNAEATLAIYSEQELLVHGASYQIPWDGAYWKKGGGWSLESPDPDQVCLLSQGWIYSEDPSGGTPGGINSHYSRSEDSEPPRVLFYGYESGEALEITYSEALAASPLNPHHFVLKPGTIVPAEAKLVKPLSTQLVLKFPVNLRERQEFRVDLPAMSDCAGNLSRKESLQGGRILPPGPGDLLINEIMFHPLDGHPEFVELFNPGPGYYDLRYLSLHVLDTEDSPPRPFGLSESSRVFLPATYLVLCSCVPHLKEAYGLEDSGRWVEMPDLPELKNSEGSLYLTDRSGGLVDQVNYSESQHMDLLVDSKGVSLERISGQRPGIESANWHSAASLVGHATPGAENSQAETLPTNDQLLQVEPKVFSPDNDGFQDLLSIRISPHSLPWVLRLWITDLSGRLIRSLANNHLAGASLSYSWDGETDQGQMVPEGIYVLHLRAYHPDSGEGLSRKEAIGVLYR